jgi:hypothetical protein
MRNRRFIMVAVILGSGALSSVMLSSVLRTQPATQASEGRAAKREQRTESIARAPGVQPGAHHAPVEAEAPHAPDVHSPVEPDELLATMGGEELTAAIAEIERELERTNAIERLNDEQVDEDERVALGFQLERISLMKHQLAVLQLEELEQSVAKYEGEHAARVAQYLGKSK